MNARGGWCWGDYLCCHSRLWMYYLETRNAFCTESSSRDAISRLRWALRSSRLSSAGALSSAVRAVPPVFYHVPINMDFKTDEFVRVNMSRKSLALPQGEELPYKCGSCFLRVAALMNRAQKYSPEATIFYPNVYLHRSMRNLLH